jgi:PAS domain S-box-containing protein
MGIDKYKNISEEIDLRCRAEEKLQPAVTVDNLPLTVGEMQRLCHEMEVYRIELELQNDELCQARNDAEHSLHKYTDLYDFAPVGYFTLDRSGTINSVNLRGASLVGVARPRLLGQRFVQLVTDEYRQVFTEFIGSVYINRDKTVCEVTLDNKENKPVVVLLEAMAAISGQECGLVVIDISERKRLENDLRGYAHRLVVLEEELRNKIATELHDKICRDLTVLGMNMAIISDGIKDVAPKKLTARAKVSGKMIKSISQTVKNIMVGLRPQVLDDYGLLATLRWHADLFSKRTDIAVTIETDEAFPRLAMEKETALFRISQEALMNVLKHATARNVTINLRRSGGMIRFAVVDDGKGFLSEAPSLIRNGSGWGMKIMRERAELIGGFFHVNSASGRGTTISVILPQEDN